MTEPSPEDTTAAAGGEHSESAGAGSVGGARPQRSLALGIALLLSYVGLSVGAALGLPVVFLVALAAGQLLDHLVFSDDYVRPLLARAQFGVATRSTVRELVAAALVLTTSWTTTGDRRVAAVALLAVSGLRLLYQLLMVAVRRRVLPPVLTRNIDLTNLRRPPQPPMFIQIRVSERQHGMSAVILLAAGIAVAVHATIGLFVVVGIALLVELGLVGVLTVGLLGSTGERSRDAVMAALRSRINALRPQVMLYHSGDPDSAYQVNMWLSTADQLPVPVVVALRERICFDALGATTSPVICIPAAVDFMTFTLPDIRVAMYTANVGKTIHMLREPGVQHVFIGHGDSDKSASSNPFSKVYSEIWVAGPAGRDRYARARIGVRDDEIVEVGRPQLGAITVAAGHRAGGRLTVLYAPTWEGWVNDPAQSSVLRTGLPLVEHLLALPGVRVVYKPHPLTGTVSGAHGRADAQIRAALTRAAALDTAAGHVVATGPEPHLYDYFNDADVLVGDISSVLSDFIASQKPYIVANLTGMPEKKFSATYPSTSAAYLLDPAANRIGEILELVRGPDPMAQARRELKRYVLGPEDPPAMVRFAAAVEAAQGRAVARYPVRPTLTSTTL